MSDVIKELISKDLKSYLETVEGHEFQNKMTLCPFHDDSKPSMSIDNKNGADVWYCHPCEIGGNIIHYVMQKYDLKKGPAIKQLASHFSIDTSAAKSKVITEYSYTDEKGKQLYKILRFKPKTFKADRKMNGIRQVLYHLPAIMKADKVWLVEGEKDVCNVQKLGLVATTSPFGLSHWKPEFSEMLKGKNVRICLDIGTEKEAEKRAASILKAGAKEVKIISLPGLEKKNQDISNWIELCDSKTNEEIAQWLEGIAEGSPVFKSSDETLIPMSLRLSDVEEKEISWLWPNYIPSDAMTLISGDPNAGKSWFLCDISAKVTRGTAWPDLSPNGNPANVYYMTYEDDIQRILKKRIRTLGGDQSRYFVYNARNPLYLSLSTEEGLKKLEAELIRIGNIRLLIIDPIIDFITARNPNAVEMVRALLTPLIAMCERLHFALIIVTHLNKDQTKAAIYRAGGSTGGWTGKSRATFLIVRDPEEKARYLMPIKNNYAFPEPDPIEFEIINDRLEYKACDVDLNKLLNPNLGRPPVASLKAKEMLADMFRDRNEIPATEIEQSAISLGISIRTLKTVKSKEGYFSEPKKADNKEDADFWVWKKPYFEKNK